MLYYKSICKINTQIAGEKKNRSTKTKTKQTEDTNKVSKINNSLLLKFHNNGWLHIYIYIYTHTHTHI